MKSTDYFQFMRRRADRARILDTWIQRVIASPLKRETQDDGRIRIWGEILEADDRYLRVILLPDGQTVHNAFFDRTFKP